MSESNLGGKRAGAGRKPNYNGYRYAQDNSLKSADQCDDDLGVNINEEFLEGCKTYFEHQEDALK